MNKVITDGLALMPPKFSEGLGVWSAGDGTAGTDTYAGSGSGVFVPADSQFDGCLEVLKTDSVVRVRYMGVTPVLPGCYLRVRARVKAVSGAFPSVRIAATPLAGGSVVAGQPAEAVAEPITSYGTVTTVEAIIGTGNRQGVDLVWNGVDGAHIGVDLTGAVGSVVRVDDIEIEDVTNVFLRDMLGLVDVRDFGAVGDGITDDSAAFEAADTAARGREVLVSKGTYRLANSVTFQSQVRFEGKVTLPQNKMLILQRNFDYATYADAFATEEEAFRRAWQAMLNYSDHNGLDLGGRKISVTQPIDMQAAEGNKTVFESRCTIRNGELSAVSGAAWNTRVVTSLASYARSSAKTLRNVANVANIEIGSLVTGTGVGREIYVRDRNIGAQTLTLSAPLYDAEGTQTFTFKRFRYLLEFDGFDKLSNVQFDNVTFACNGVSSGILMARDGFAFQLRDCHMTKPADRGLTSIGRGCQDLLIDRCQFMSNEARAPAQTRKTLVFNANANDVKIRDNRIVRFRHFCVLGGDGTILTGNHWFHGDNEPDGVRLGGLVLTKTNPKTMITGNYIDNNAIEWTNEHEADPAMGNQYSFGGLTITGNTFTNNDVADWFRWIVVKPYGPGHFIHGLTVTGNVFRSLNGSIGRVETVNTAIADLDRSMMRNVVFANNVFHGVDVETVNPLSVGHTQSSAQSTWTVDTGGQLPFDGWARKVESIAPENQIKQSNGTKSYAFPGVQTQQGGGKDQIQVIWPTAVRGKVRCAIRMDNPN